MPLSQFTTEELPGPFLNRDTELALIEQHIAAHIDDPRHFAVLEVWGLGGVGKTRVLKEARHRARDQVKHVAWISLMAEASTMAVGPLRKLRDDIDIECLLFEAALLKYYAAMGQSYIEVDRRRAESLAARSIEAGAKFVVPIPVSLTLAVDLYRSFASNLERRLYYEEEEFAAIDALRDDSAALLERLPYYLGLDIARHLDATDEPLVVFYDAYDKQSDATVGAKATWLRNLIDTLDRGVHVISMREPLDWPDRWGDVIRAIPINRLPEVDSRALVRVKLPDVPIDVETRLLQASRQIPLVLKSLIEQCVTRAGENGGIDIDDLPTSSDEILTHLLGHLTGDRRRVAVAFGAVQMFDVGLYRHLTHALGLPIGDRDFSAVAERLFVEDLGNGLYTTHDLLTDAARRSAQDRALRTSALHAATEYLRIRATTGGLETPDTLLPLFGAMLTGWCSVEAMSPDSAAAFVDAAYLLYDAGLWRELVSMAPAGMPPEHPVAVIGEFFQALATRRTVGVDRALKILDGLGSRGEALGRHARSVEIEVAYLHELAGDYARARVDFRSLSRRATPFDPTDRIHLRSRMYHADMLIMDGALQEASRLLVDTYEAVGPAAKLEWAELVRCRARAFYCAFLLDESADLLLQSADAAVESPAMLAKLHTNLAECYCWHAPERALEAASLSHELNVRLRNRIDMAKCDAAKGIALAREGEFDAAEAVISSSAAEAEAVGYPGGVAFALQARAVARALARDEAGFRVAYGALSDAVTSLDTYGHLRVGPAWLSGDDGLFLEAAVDVDWIELDTLDARLGQYLGQRS